MKRQWTMLMLSALISIAASVVFASEEHRMGGENGMMEKGGIRSQSKEEQIKAALSAAPPEIAKEATVKVYIDGKLIEAKKGTNGFVCYPDISNLSEPDPICNNPAAEQWLNDLISGKEKPTIATPGVSYMAAGGWHFEKEGKIVMADGEGAKKVRQPPHWMIFWPFDSKTTGLPANVNPLGTYIMFDGTPYAHLMIYQHPKGIR